MDLFHYLNNGYKTVFKLVNIKDLFGLVLYVPDTVMAILRQSLHLTTLFSGASLTKQLTSTSCTYFGLINLTDNNIS